MTPSQKADAAKEVIELVVGQTDNLDDLADILAMAARACLPGYAFTVIIEQKK